MLGHDQKKFPKDFLLVASLCASGPLFVGCVKRTDLRPGLGLVRFTHPTRSARVTDVALAAAHRLATGRKNIQHGEKIIHLWEIFLLTRMGRICQLTQVCRNIPTFLTQLLASPMPSPP
jgi:hypothetical protein